MSGSGGVAKCHQLFMPVFSSLMQGSDTTAVLGYHVSSVTTRFCTIYLPNDSR